MKTIWLRPSASDVPLEMKPDALVSTLSEIEALVL
jgi:hypothetical protein